ncbi:MAG: hypothetical protein M0C28_21150 [Candidatus Moduliflexus flocculans]|nr:hypothetical protein [Candidatus Moduliflexus flocculans]
MALKRPPIIAALAAFVIVSALPAQEGGLTLERAVELALSGHPEIREARARVEAARGRTLQFASRPEPQLTAGLEGIPSRASGRKVTSSRSASGSSRCSSIPASAPSGPKSAGRGGPGRRRARPCPAPSRRPGEKVLLAGGLRRGGRHRARALRGPASTPSSRTSSRNTGRARPRTAMSSGPGRKRPGCRNQALDQARERRTAELELDRTSGAFARRCRGTRDAPSVHPARGRSLGTVGAGPDDPAVDAGRIDPHGAGRSGGQAGRARPAARFPGRLPSAERPAQRLGRRVRLDHCPSSGPAGPGARRSRRPRRRTPPVSLPRRSRGVSGRPSRAPSPPPDRPRARSWSTSAACSRTSRTSSAIELEYFRYGKTAGFRGHRPTPDVRPGPDRTSARPSPLQSRPGRPRGRRRRDRVTEHRHEETLPLDPLGRPAGPSPHRRLPRRARPPSPVPRSKTTITKPRRRRP